MDTSEKGFETEIVEHLHTAHGYRVRKGHKQKDAPHYDLKHHLDPDLLLEFLTATQAEEWARLEAQLGTQTTPKFLQRLASQLERHGLHHLFHSGLKINGCLFHLAYFQPATTLNPTHLAQYQRNIFSAMRQVHYSSKNNNSLDVVLCLNGLPFATLELKNKLTGQDNIKAIVQYQRDRDPQGEPLLAFKRCLVHFALDGDEVYMATHLQGKATYFLPFNCGNRGGAGNPINPHGYATSYLWEDVFAPASLLELIQHFVYVEKKDDQERLIFPRYHQRDAVRRLLALVQQEGAGRNYLIQHSAGSGKSKTIAWLAHRLAALHNAHNERIFHTVIIITDRRVLDKQLRGDVLGTEKQTGVVEAVDKDSQQLRRALEEGRDIIVTTLQKFPAIIQRIAELSEEEAALGEKLATAVRGRQFAIIADEAHSSQSGETSKSIKQLLTLEGEEGQDEEPLTGEDLINLSMSQRGRQANLSFFGFTATPKEKTLELFGLPQPDGSYQPAHLYTMRQAIEEGFIEDVLANYTTYGTYFNLLKKIEEDPRYPKSKAIGQMKRYVSLHEFTIAQKVEIMVTHFWNNIRHELPNKQGVGQAKAMVVTRSRLHAVRYKLAFDTYLKKQGYSIQALVAFSGEVEDGGEKYTEAKMNGFADTQTAGTFKQPAYRFLIVAEKFQTGFDEPLLYAMYVDKVLSGVNAVQTLSRLNRAAGQEKSPVVLDFANEAEDIRKAFQPFYETTILSEGSDPNKLYDLYDLLGGFGVYTAEEVAEVAELFLRQGEKAKKLQPFLRTAVDRFNYLGDFTRQEEFRHHLQTYIRQYAFLSQVMPFQDGDLERLYLYARLLARMLPAPRTPFALHIHEHVDLESYRLQQLSSGPIKLERGEGRLEPLSAVSGRAGQEDEQSLLSQIIAELNERFGTEFDEGDKVFFAELKTRMANHESIQHSAKVNGREHVRLLFETLFPGILQTMIESNFELYKRITDETAFRKMVIGMLFEDVYQAILAGNEEG